MLNFNFCRHTIATTIVIIIIVIIIIIIIIIIAIIIFIVVSAIIIIIITVLLPKRSNGLFTKMRSRSHTSELNTVIQDGMLHYKYI